LIHEIPPLPDIVYQQLKMLLDEITQKPIMQPSVILSESTHDPSDRSQLLE